MTAVILAGGKGTRMTGPGLELPKPLVPAGGAPLVVHLMRYLRAGGVDRILMATGHRADVFQRYFDLHPEPELLLVDTGEQTQTGGRLKRLQPLLSSQESFLVVYADTFADIDLMSLLDFHARHGKLATLAAVPHTGRYGHVRLNGYKVEEFREKPRQWVSSGFFVLQPQALQYVESDETVWEREPVQRLAQDGELMAYLHEGFWMAVDTPEELAQLDLLCRQGRLPWKER